MALQNNPNLYTGGYERINLAPHVALYANLKAREQARNEAFDGYMRNINMRINPAGMRHNERPVFEDKLRRWQEFGLQNREALQNPRKDGGRASIEFQAGYQDLQNLIERSKSVEHLKKPGVDLMGDPTKMDRVNKDRLMKGFQAVDQDLYVQDPQTGQWVDNPNWRPFSQADIEFRNKPFESGKFLKDDLGDIKASKTRDLPLVKNPNDLTQVRTTVADYTPDDMERIASRTIAKYGEDESMKDMIKGLPEAEKQSLRQIYKNTFGQDADDDVELAVGWAVKSKAQSTVTEKIEDDKFAQQKELENLRQAGRRGLAHLRRGWQLADKATQDTWVSDYIDQVSNNAKLTSPVIEYKYKDGSTVKGHVVPLDEILSKAVGFNDKNPGQLIVTDDGEYITAFFKTDNAYKPIKGADNKYTIESDKTRRFDKNRLKLNLAKIAAGQKQTNVEMSVDDDDLTGSLD